jgi:opacity protein-like surface antigen
MLKKLFFFVTVIAITMPLDAAAEAKAGFYMGVGAAYNTIQGDLDGKTLEGGMEAIILPDINSALGLDVRAGYRINDTWSVEFNFLNSKHSGTWAGLKGDVGYFSYSINGKYSFSATDAVQPYLMIGISDNTLLIKKGAANLLTGETGDATLTGGGLNLGAGIDQDVGSHISVTIGLMYRYVDFTSAEGIHESGSIDQGLNGSGFSLVLSSAYHF